MQKGTIEQRMFNIALMLIITIASIMLITSSLFLIGIPITFINLPLGLIISLSIFYICNNKDKRDLMNTLILMGLIFIISMIVCYYIQDFTFDSNSYHKTAIGSLKGGWNPVYQSSVEFNILGNKYPFNTYDTYSIWVDHYSKGPWFFAATLYKFINSIEAVKIINLLMLIACGFISYAYLKIKFSSKIFGAVIAISMAITPVTIVQVFSYYVDGLLANSFYILLISLIIYKDKEFNISDKSKKVLIFSIIIILGNIKFTGLGLAGIFCVVFYIYWLVRTYIKKGFIEFKNLFKELTALFGISAFATIFIVGSSTYIKNIIDHNHPFYPLFGKDKVDIMTANQPEIFAEIDGIKKLFYGIFGQVENIYAADHRAPQLKMPFSVNENELLSLSTCDIRISGFGVWFSGILIISVTILIIVLIKNLIKKDNIELTYNILLIVMLGTILLLVLEDSWWARYSPHLYLYIILAMILLLSQFKNHKALIYKYVSSIMTILITINLIFFIAYNLIPTIKTSARSTVERQRLKEIATSENVVLEVNISNPNLYGIYYNLDEITTDYKKDMSLEEPYNYALGNILLYRVREKE